MNAVEVAAENAALKSVTRRGADSSRGVARRAAKALR